ncbi:MAG: diaminopimelate decarboxylase [Desulfovibrio sp.]|nr:diaminopimelate decarboxylase [Desulfovibrio sp.]
MPNNDFEALTARYGYPLYLYNASAIVAQLDSLRAALPGFECFYSVKTNPHPGILALMNNAGTGADAASAAEVDRAARAGFSPDRIMYSAPGKRREDLEQTLDRCILVADSYVELALLQRMCEEKNRTASVGLRVNPNLAFGPGTSPELLPGAPAKFGVDVESLPAHRAFFASLTRVRLCGIHVYVRSQVLDHRVLCAYLEHVLDLARFCVTDIGCKLDFINFGGGFGVPCAPADSPINWQGLRPLLERVAARGDDLKPGRLRFIVESGRYLVAAAGTFVTKVTDVKKSRGRIFVLAPGALNNFMRPALMNLFASFPHPVPVPLEPLYSGIDAFAVSIPGREGEEKVEVTVAGTLCTALDCMAAKVALPLPRVGDILCVNNAGAYACTLSPHEFAGLGRPQELLLAADGSVSAYPEYVASRRGRPLHKNRA